MVQSVALERYNVLYNNMDDCKHISDYNILIDKYIDLIEEKEEIDYKISPNLKKKYLHNFAMLMKDELNTIINIKKLNREKEILALNFRNRIQYQMGKKEDIIFEKEIELLLKQIDKIDTMSNENTVKLNKLTYIEEVELKQLFKLLMKRLSPDLNKSQTSIRIRLWNRTVGAYRKNDLSSLRILSNLIYEEIDYNTDIQIEDLQIKINSLSKYIKKAKNEFPLNMEENLLDEEWVNTNRIEIIKRLDGLRKQENELKRFVYQ